jgi:diacylglycerol kinase
MVCCAFIAALLGILAVLLRPFSSNRAPLAWRSDQLGSKDAPFRLHARLASFGYAFAGIKYVVTHEHNMRIHIVAAVVVVIMGVVVSLNMDQWRWIGLASLLVLFAETLNTAIEQACDALGGQHNEHVRIAKDVAAGAVLLTCGFALLIGLSVFGPYVAATGTPLVDFSTFPMCLSAK